MSGNVTPIRHQVYMMLPVDEENPSDPFGYILRPMEDISKQHAGRGRCVSRSRVLPVDYAGTDEIFYATFRGPLTEQQKEFLKVMGGEIIENEQQYDSRMRDSHEMLCSL